MAVLSQQQQDTRVKPARQASPPATEAFA